MLLEYLQDYTDRVKPLQDQNELFGKIQNEFEKKWENGTFPGWPVSCGAGGGHVKELNSLTLTLSLWASGSCDSKGSFARYVRFSFHSYFGMRFVRASLPLAEPRIFINYVVTAGWFLLTRNCEDYMLEVSSMYFHS